MPLLVVSFPQRWQQTCSSWALRSSSPKQSPTGFSQLDGVQPALRRGDDCKRPHEKRNVGNGIAALTTRPALSESNTGVKGNRRLMGHTMLLLLGAVVEQARCTEKGAWGEGFCAIKRRVLGCLEQI